MEDTYELLAVLKRHGALMLGGLERELRHLPPGQVDKLVRLAERGGLVQCGAAGYDPTNYKQVIYLTDAGNARVDG